MDKPKFKNILEKSDFEFIDSILTELENSEYLISFIRIKDEFLSLQLELTRVKEERDSLKCCGNCKHSFGDDCFKNQNYIDDYHSVCDGWEYGDICEVGE